MAQEAEHHHSHGKRHGMKKKIVIIAASVLFVAAIAAAVYFFLQYNALKSNPSGVNQQKTSEVVEKVSKIYALPNETPTIADITDKDKLKDQAFFKDAENGDHLLIFSKAKVAILYRESSNKLINVGPIALSDETVKGQEDTSKSK